MNPGLLKERVEILRLDNTNNNFFWTVEATVWAKVEQQKIKNIFSNVGLGAKSLKIIIRKWDITLHNAIKWRGKHCFLTDITDLGNGLYEIMAALIEPQICTVERTDAHSLNELNRPVYSEPVMITFPGYLTEKYIRTIQDEPMSMVESQYVLVTPKSVNLQEGELVTINNVTYEVLVAHILDEYKNEYEILVRRDR